MYIAIIYEVRIHVHSALQHKVVNTPQTLPLVLTKCGLCALLTVLLGLSYLNVHFVVSGWFILSRSHIRSKLRKVTKIRKLAGEHDVGM